MSALAPWVESWARLMAAITWQLAALAALALVCERLFRLRHPGARYALWWFVLLAPLLLAPARLWLAEVAPRWRVAVPVSSAAAALIPQGRTERSPEGVGAGAELRRGASAAAPGLPLVGAALWLLGCSPLAVRLIAGQRRARHLATIGEPATETEMVETLADLCRRAGISRPVALRAGAGVDSPMLCGVTRPVVVLPREWLAELGMAHLRALLAHEVAHARRGDVFANLVQRWLEGLLFFHPGVWLASRRAALAREELCDEWALTHGATRASYARALAMAAERAPARPCLAMVGLAEGRPSLLARMEAIMKRDGRRRTSRLALAGLAAVAAVAGVALVAARVGGARADGRDMAQAATGGVGWQDASRSSGAPSVQPRMGLTLADLDQRALRRYAVERRAGDYPPGESTARPELTYAAIQQALARGDMSAFARVNASRLARQASEVPPPVSVTPAVAAALLDTKILEVWLYHDQVAVVIAHIRRPDKSAPYFAVRAFELERGRWLNSGESLGETLEEARTCAARVLDYGWRLAQAAR